MKKFECKYLVGYLYKALDIFRGFMLLFVTITACALSLFLMWKLYKTWPENLSNVDIHDVLTNCLTAFITVGGFAITLFLLISDRRKRKIERLTAQVCAYHVEEQLMIDRIQFLEDIIKDADIEVDLGVEVTGEMAKKEHFRKLAYSDPSNYLCAYPKMSALDACKVKYSL